MWELVIGKIESHSKYLVQWMDFESEKTNSSQVYPRIHPFLLDGFSLDPKFHPGKILKNLLKIFMDKEQG